MRLIGNQMKNWSFCILNFSFLNLTFCLSWEVISLSGIWYSVSSPDETPWSSSKKLILCYSLNLTICTVSVFCKSWCFGIQNGTANIIPTVRVKFLLKTWVLLRIVCLQNRKIMYSLSFPTRIILKGNS